MLAVAADISGYKGMVPPPEGTEARALVVIGHNPSMNVPEFQIQVRTRTIVDVVKYKPSPGGMGDADWYNSPESQWWTVRRPDGRVGLVPMTSLELIEETQANGELAPVAGGAIGTGYESADGVKPKKGAGSAKDTWVMPPNEWNVGCCGRVKKILGSLKYNEWSKWAQLFACYIVVFEGLATAIWDFNENDRLDFDDNGTSPFDYKYCATMDTATNPVTFVYCDHEVGVIHVVIGIVCAAVYVLFIMFERSRGAPSDAPWGEKMKAPGPPKILRLIVNVALSILLHLQPSP